MAYMLLARMPSWSYDPPLSMHYDQILGWTNIQGFEFQNLSYINVIDVNCDIDPAEVTALAGSETCESSHVVHHRAL